MTIEKKRKAAKDILAAKDLKTEDVFVEPWDCWITVSVMDGRSREIWEQAMVKLRDDKSVEGFRSWLVAQTVVDEDGKRVFTDSQIKDLNTKSAVALQTIFEVAQRLNGLREKDVVQIEGNSAPGLSGAPGSDSP